MVSGASWASRASGASLVSGISGNLLF
jgi:hypothetical protein